jgi:hypothetical protein
MTGTPLQDVLVDNKILRAEDSLHRRNGTGIALLHGPGTATASLLPALVVALPEEPLLSISAF